MLIADGFSGLEKQDHSRGFTAAGLCIVFTVDKTGI